MNPGTQVFLAALATAVATGVGALPFLVVRSMSPHVVAYAYALAGGLMLGACFGLVAEGTEFGATQTVLGGLIGVIGILIFYLALRARGIPLSSQEFALSRNAPQLLSDHAHSGAR